MDRRLSPPRQHPSLLGRATERALLDEFAAAIRRGHSRVLVVRGEAGIGKTALLDHLYGSAPDLMILRAIGIEAEMEFAYAGLHQLCTPLLHRLERLPEPQRHALETVFGLKAGSPPDRFLVGLGVLSLLSDAADERALLCVIDDAQWLGQASVLALAFVARRLLAERIGIVFAARSQGDELRGFQDLEVLGLRNGEARALLGSAVQYRLDERVRDRIIAETRGNPLALLELPRGLTATQLAGGFGLAEGGELSGPLEQSFVRRLAALPEAARRLLVLASAEPLGDPLLLWRAADRLAIAPGAAGAAEADGLVAISERVTFRHPLVRSTVYRSASPGERRAAHLALAEATDRDVDPDRRIWHLAAAATGPDERVASELERSAGRARSRAGVGASAAFLRRALELTADTGQRAGRALAAARASLEAGEFDIARELLATTEAGPANELQHASVELLRGQIAFASGRWGDAPPLLLKAAQRLEPFDLELARQTYLDALLAAIFAGSFAGAGLTDQIARAALASATLPEPRRPSDVLLEGLARSVTEGVAAGVAMLSRAARAFAEDEIGTDEGLRWGWGAACAALAHFNEEHWHSLAAGQLRFVREAGLMMHLLNYQGMMGIDAALRGEFTAARAMNSEADEIAKATGTPLIPTAAVLLAGLRGREHDATQLITTSASDARVAQQGITIQWCEWVSAILHNGLGEYAKAFAAAAEAVERAPEVFASIWTLPELIEAATRTGQMDRAGETLERLVVATSAGDSDWGLGIQARSRALVSEGEEAERCYQEAIERLGRTQCRPDLARGHLLYGEWLRRQQRRVDARAQLRTAFEQFTAIGMEAFADRAGRELLATGEKVRTRSVETRDDLTDQERQIAQLARDGLSNPEIGARLFLSPRTVEWHLRKVFGKLGIRSRRELRDALAGSDPVAI